ncbi:hypothetical protein NGB36_31750 [Streptomyces sp. RB6PN25]|uniref:Secreted protein n=1 Tax=Streptomyces humicola TaxID=2953240 RepID=A0ABT1Q6J3_9ACTN|nr:hypothetical protein [Streptomyces humicola]MCQ4085013.1 hypothetical protein [Streptomyces humicola]
MKVFWLILVAALAVAAAGSRRQGLLRRAPPAQAVGVVGVGYGRRAQH